jgi:hypothetical protein
MRRYRPACQSRKLKYLTESAKAEELKMTDHGYKKIMLISFLFCLFTLPLILSGCATLGKDECLNADWFSIGYEDGARGYHTSRIGGHRKACAKHGVTPDFNAYEKGRQKGLAEWCSPRNANRIGLTGGTYNGVCPKNLEPAFLQALNQGKAVYAYEKEYRNQNQTLKKMYADLDGIDRKIADLEAELISNGVSPRRRKALLEEIRLREEDRRLLLMNITAAEKTVADMRNNLEQMKADNPYK